MFHPDLQVAIKGIKELVEQGKKKFLFEYSIVSFTDLYNSLVESWGQKGKFPPSLKPPLADLAILAIKLDEYDEDFFALMPTLFPYNKFTMTVRVFPLFPLYAGTCVCVCVLWYLTTTNIPETYQANDFR